METDIYQPKHKIRFVTASSLFDGHDASINIFRRILQRSGAEVIHLGHNRSAEEVVKAAIEEDVHGIALSSYQGGHIEYFKYIYDMLQTRGAGHIKIFGGGGGVIVPQEIRELEEYGIRKIFSPEDGRRLGLQGIINFMLRETDYSLTDKQVEIDFKRLKEKNPLDISRLISIVEEKITTGNNHENSKIKIFEEINKMNFVIPVVGITGTGGAGKSSLTDELVRRYLTDFSDKKIAILSVDPSKQKTGGALLGDRIRMNSINNNRTFMRSLATRESNSELSLAIKEAMQIVKASGYDLIIVETSGIGQGDTGIVKISDISIYVMTSEFGAPTQLEKIDMLDYADLIVINKFDRKGSEDALRDVRKQYRRNHELYDLEDEQLPIFGTVASRFNDRGTNNFYLALLNKINEVKGLNWQSEVIVKLKESTKNQIIPPERERYLDEIAKTVKEYHYLTNQQSDLARKLFQLKGSQAILADKYGLNHESVNAVKKEIAEIETLLHPETKKLLENWPKLKELYQQDDLITKVREIEIASKLNTTTLAGTKISKIALPKYEDLGEITKWCMKENVPGSFPYTAGVFPFKRTNEDPKRQFAGEGTPERTNKRFHYLSKDDPAKRLSTAFDSVTLYGEDPDRRPDIYGKIGESGVSIATIDDMKKLYDGFDLCSPNTSVSMTINGPAPIILAMFMNTAIVQQVEKFENENGRKPNQQELEAIREYTLQTVRGTVQADILKEDQGQNTCIFSTEFALKMMGDIQEYFIDQKVRNYYSVSISGYHIAEAGANPITQLAFTLANGFTYVEYYLSRGMKIDDFAPNLSFFFSNGLDAEYAVLGRVARRIWAVAMKYKYGASERSQKLKYHIQTSGRSLHAMEIDFNDIRTTLQALLALYDNCNSLHTNAYDEAITTPTEGSVRRAMAIQMIITKELGLAKNENPLQGSFIIEELTDLVENAVIKEFERISSRGGVLGAMETVYQRGKIQEESMLYETKKNTGELPIIGVNTFLNSSATEDDISNLELARSTKEEKETQIQNLTVFQAKNADLATEALKKLKATAVNGGNIFGELMNTVRVASLGQITRALYEVGGQYRRNM